VSGRLVDTIGVPDAYVVTSVSGVLTAVAAVAGARTLRTGATSSAEAAPPAA